MTDHTKDVEEQRAQIREELSDDNRQADDQDAKEATLAPPGHVGERMNERER
jgi:hypothetical protein